MIAVGEDVKDTTSDEDRRFALVASSDGTLVIQLSWDDSTAAVLQLTVDGVDIPEGCCNWRSPVIARVNVRRGQQILVAVKFAGTIWDYARLGPQAANSEASRNGDAWTVEFVLSTSLE